MFSRWTPQGALEMFLTNPIAAEKFEVGREYYLDFSVAHPEKGVSLPINA